MNQQQLLGKVIFISGVAGLLGKISTKMFLERGAIVVGSDIIPLEQCKELLEIQKTFDANRFCFIPADVSKEEDVESVFTQIQNQFGKVDGVFHNAFKQAVKPMRDLSLDEWQGAINGTLTSTFLVNKYAVSSMVSSGGGSIVNTSSILAQIPKRKNTAYGAAKAGIHQFTKVVALENGGQGIRANVLIPGNFRSEESLHRMAPEKRKAIEERYLLGRAGRAEEMSEMAAFLLSDAASYVTASLINVDGGYRSVDGGYR